MTEVPARAVDLAVTSPPYFCVKDYAGFGGRAVAHRDDCGAIRDYRDYVSALLDVWNECCRVLKPNGKLIVNAPLMPLPKRETSTHHNRDIFNIYSDIEHSILRRIPGMHLMDVYVWNRVNPMKRLMFGSYPYPRNLYAQNTVEFIGVFAKAGKPAPADRSAKLASKLSESEWREYTKQVWDLPVPSRADVAVGRGHPAIMPAEIARRCIRLYSCVGDVVLDPFAGSGTVLQAARELGRSFVGYELYEHYAPVINRKLTLDGWNQAFAPDGSG